IPDYCPIVQNGIPLGCWPALANDTRIVDTIDAIDTVETPNLGVFTNTPHRDAIHRVSTIANAPAIDATEHGARYIYTASLNHASPLLWKTKHGITTVSLHILKMQDAFAAGGD
ncbi:MAG: hypothetical protein LBD27_02660, partial [Tannerella sp.]|nr:hypothetical protein [Tannerella sp.]